VNKICVFDWDIHHGDGTQSIFYNDDRLLYISLHRCDNLTFYPWNAEMRSNYIGEGKGKGYNVNVAWDTGKLIENNEYNRLINEEYGLGN
jgi:histone deacetylase 6